MIRRLFHVLAALTAVLLLPLVALAQEVAAAPPADATNLFDQLLVMFGSAALAAATWGLKLLTDWLATKIKNEKWAGIVSRLDDLALRAVRDVQAAYVDALVEAKKDDGVVSSAEYAEAKRRAMAALKSFLGPKGLAEIAKLLGAENLDSFLGATLESALANHQNAEAISSGPR